MQRISQVVAVEKTSKQKLNKEGGDILKALQKAELFEGHTKTYIPKVDGGDTLPEENKYVQKVAYGMVKDVEKLYTEYLDVCATRDIANCEAKADISVDGILILEKVPATFLLFLEHQLVEYAQVLAAMPTLDPTEKWEFEKDSGLCKSAPKTTQKTSKVPEVITLAQATDKHPAQAQLVQVDKVVGNWTTTRMSGAIAPTVKKALLEKVESLIKGVKKAREEANYTAAPPREVGKILFKWIWEGIG